MKIETTKDYGASLDELTELVKDVKSDRSYPIWRIFRKVMYEEKDNHDLYHDWIFKELENAAIEKLKEIFNSVVVSDKDGMYTLLEYSNSTLDDGAIWMNEKSYNMSLN